MVKADLKRCYRFKYDPVLTEECFEDFSKIRTNDQLQIGSNVRSTVTWKRLSHRENPSSKLECLLFDFTDMK